MDRIEHLLRRSIREVFGQQDITARRRAIAEIFTEDCIFIAPDGRHEGHDALEADVAALQARLPGYAFSEEAVTLLDGAGLLEWSFGPPEDLSRITGIDVALVQDERIATLMVFLKP